MPTASNANGPLQNWLSVLDAMSQCVAHTLQSVDDREPGSANAAVESAAAPRDAEFRRRLDATIRGLEQRLDAARTLASRIEVLLDRDEQEVRAWRATAEASRQRLAAAGRL